MRAASFARRVAGLGIAAACLAAVGAGQAAAQTTVTPKLTASATPTARGGAEQAYAVGLHPRARAGLLAAGGRTLQTKRVDGQGGVLFRGVRPGRGDRIASGSWRSGPLRVLTDRASPPSIRLYGQRLRAGYQYLTVRDGTRLAIDVHLPHPVLASSLVIGGLKENDSIVRVSKPYPTLVEYSGYGYANPAGPVNGIANLANLLGFAVVDVSMRGTGCSGGAFDYFDRDESLDGYDAIETIAHQPWVLDHKVGMLGISYGGISQLFTAATDPPALEAIAPLSPIDSTITTLYPGGDLNTGFAGTWATQRVQDAEPFSRTSDQSYALKRIREGDTICRANQALHGEAVNLTHEIAQQRYFHPGFDNPLDPVTFVHRIHAATFLACQFTDEETGGHCPDLAEDFTGTRRKWFYFQNGTHTDSLDPETLVRLVDFYELYVAHRKPVLDVDVSAGHTTRTGLDAALPLFGPTLLKMVMGIHGTLNDVPADPVESAPTYRAALALFNATPEVTIGFDNGAAAGNTPGIPMPAFTAGATGFPLPGTEARLLVPGPGRSAQHGARDRRHRHVHLPRRGGLGDRLARPQRRSGGPVGAASPLRMDLAEGRPGGLVRHRAAEPEHGGGRRRIGEPLGEVDQAGRRSAGDDHRGPARRQRGLRPERLPARRRQRPHQGLDSAAVAAHAAPLPAASALRRPLDARDDPALLRGPRLPGGLPHPCDHRLHRR